MSAFFYSTATCDICRKVFNEKRKRFYCVHCAQYFYVCNDCKNTIPKCPTCGVRMIQKSEPVVLVRKVS